MKIRKGDTVFIRTGKSKGQTGKVLFVDLKNDSVLVEGVNMMKKHQKPTQQSPKGGIISIEAPVHISNVALFSNTLNGPTRLSSKVVVEGGKKTKMRICRKTGEQI